MNKRRGKCVMFSGGEKERKDTGGNENEMALSAACTTLTKASQNSVET